MIVKNKVLIKAPIFEGTAKHQKQINDYVTSLALWFVTPYLEVYQFNEGNRASKALKQAKSCTKMGIIKISRGQGRGFVIQSSTTFNRPENVMIFLVF